MNEDYWSTYSLIPTPRSMGPRNAWATPMLVVLALIAVVTAVLVLVSP